MRLSTVTVRNPLIVLLCIVVSSLSSHAQQARKSNSSITPAANIAAVFPATPPYNFRVIAQTGDVIGGQKIKNFITTGGANVALNDKGQTAFKVITETGEAIFRGDTRRSSPPNLVASSPTSSKSGIGLSVPAIDSQGRVAYLRVTASQPRDGLTVINNDVVLRPGQLTVNQSKLAVRAFVPIDFDAADRLETVAVFDGNHVPVLCINGKYSQELAQKRVPLRGLPYGVRNDQGQILYRVTTMDEPEQVLRRGDNNLYPFRPMVYAINDRGQIFVGDVKGKLAIFPYADCLPTTDPHRVSSIQPEYDNKYIPNADEGIGEALQAKTSTLVSWLVDGKTHYSFDTTLHIHDDHAVTNTTNHLSVKGVSVAINNHNQIAFFVEWRDKTGTPVALGYSFKMHQALLVGTPGTPVSDAIELSKATTTDAQSVSVDYTIKEAGVSSVHFDVYRSPTEDIGFTKIGEQDITDAQDLTSGKHQGVKLISGTELTPNTSMPYVVVKATCNGTISRTYFRKWMLGVIAHGYSTWATSWSTPGSSTFADFSLPTWTTKTADELKAKDGYDDVIVHPWTQSCGSSEHGVTNDEGMIVSNLVSKWILAKESGPSAHSGDVVDIHFIGHNRGAVVVSEALNDLNVHGPFPELSEGKECSFGGGYVEVTLLDPIPFNGKSGNKFADFASILAGIELGSVPPTSLKDLYAPAFIGAVIFHFTNDIKKIYQDSSDPDVLIPSDVHTCVVWYQHNSAESCAKNTSLEHVFNFWGQVGDGALNNMAMSHAAPVNVSAKAAGYMEVPDLYYVNIVTSGLLNRSAN